MFKNVILTFVMSLATIKAGSLADINVSGKMSADFLTGFEGGIFLKKDTSQFEEYGCPEQHPENVEINMLKTSF